MESGDNMRYALNINPADGRILSATYEQYASPGMPIVETLPDGNLVDYRFIDGEYVYDPIPIPGVIVIADKNYAKGDVATVDGTLYEFTENVPRGCKLVEGQNVKATSYDEQLAKLKGELQ